MVHKLVGAVVALAVVLGVGCASPETAKAASPRVVTLRMGLFPSDLTAGYRIVVDFFGASGYLQEVDLGPSVASSEQFDEFILPAGTTRFGIYLLDPSKLNDYPVYFDFHQVGPAQTVYESGYWLDYSGYFLTSPQQIRFGISDQAVVEPDSFAAQTFNFRYAPYYLLRYPNANASLVTAAYSSVGDPVWAGFFSSMDALRWAQRYAWSGAYASAGTLQSTDAPVYLLVQPSEFATATTATVSFGEIRRKVIDDTISCLVPTDRADTVYAVTANTHWLYRVDPLAGTATKLAELPLANVFKMVYSAADQKLYGCTGASGTLLIYDVAAGTASTVVYAAGSTGQGIDVDPVHRRLYLCAGYRLYILDQDSQALINSLSLYYTEGDIAYSAAERAILHTGIYQIKKVSVADDVITDTNVKYESMGYYNGRGFVVGPGGSMLAASEFQLGYGFRTIRASTMLATGYWEVGAYPSEIHFAPDGASVYASRSNGRVYRAPVSDLTKVDSWNFPATDFVVNGDGGRLVGFRSDEKSFYFLDVTTAPTVPPAASASAVLKALAARSAGGPEPFLPRAGR